MGILYIMRIFLYKFCMIFYRFICYILYLMNVCVFLKIVGGKVIENLLDLFMLLGLMFL